MSLIFRLLVRFLAIVVGYGIACLALSVFVHALVLGGLSPRPPQETDLVVITSIVTVPVLAALAGYHLFAPAAVLIVIAEIRNAHDWLAHSLGGGAATLVAAWFSAVDPRETFTDTGLMAVIVAAGLVGGWVYWFIAGRRSGAWKGTVTGLTSSGS